MQNSANNVFISKQNGNWGATTTWVNGALPATTDMVVIRHAVALEAAHTASAVDFDMGNGSLTGTFGLTNTGQFTVLTGPTGSASSTVSAPIVVGSNVVKNGPGMLTLSGANTYTGPTTVNGGTLKAGSTAAFGSNSAVTLANDASATLDITGFNVSIGSLTGGGDQGGNISLGVQTLTIGTDNTSPAAYAGVISDSGTGNGGSIIKTGTGTLTLTGKSTYTGTTTINAGVLSTNLLDIVGNPSGIGAGFVTSSAANLILGGGTLQYTGPSTTTDYEISVTNLTIGTFDVTVASSTLTITGAISNPTTTGGVTKIGAGTLHLGNPYSAYTGVTKISAGTLTAYLENGLLLSGIGKSSNAATNLLMDGGTLRVAGYGGTDRNFTITAGKTATFDVPAGTPLDFTGAAAATTGNVVKTGPGDLIFEAAQKYTGTTTINGGTLRLKGNAGAIASSPTISVNAGATLDIDSAGSTEPVSPGRIASTASVTLNGGTFSMEAGTSASRLQTVSTLAITPGTANTISLCANGNFKCQLTAGGTLPTLSSGTTLNLIRNVGGATGTANLFYSGQTTNISAPISGCTVNYQSAKYDATSATPQGLIQASGNIVATAAAGNWGTAATWVGNAVPAVGDTVVIHHAVTLEAPHTAQVVMFDYVGAGSLATGNESPLTNTSGIFTLISTTAPQINVPIAGTALVLNGENGTMTLGDTNTYTGTTTINPGMVLAIVTGNVNPATLGSGPVANNGMLQFIGVYGTIYGNDISGSGALEITGVQIGGANYSADVTLTGNNTSTGPVTLNGALRIGNGGTTGTLGSGSVAGIPGIGGGNMVSFNRSDNIVVANAFDATNGLLVQQDGSGTLTLTGSLYSNVPLNATAGNLSIALGPSASAGQINASGTGTITISSGTNLTVSYASVANTGNTIVPAGAALTSTGSINVSGNGTLTVNGTAQSSSLAVSGNGTLIVNGTAQGVTLSSSAAPSPASAGCLLRGTGTAGAVVTTDPANRNAVVWPGLAKTVGALTASEQLTVGSVDFSSGGKIAVVVKNSGGFSQKLVITNSATLATSESVFSFATDATPATPTSYTVLSCTNGLISESFSTIDAPPGFVLGTHYDLRYSISGASPKLQSVIGPHYTLVGGYNQMDLVFTGNSVTPVTVDGFTAQTEGAGVRLDWHCVSEFQNAGFNIYRRAIQESGVRGQESGWTRVNPALIAGRITNPDAKRYQYYEWAEPGVFEYKLESVSMQGGREAYRDIAGVTVDAMAASPFTIDDLDTAVAGVEAAASIERGWVKSLAFNQTAIFQRAASVREIARGEPNLVGQTFLSAGSSLSRQECLPHQKELNHAAMAGARWFSASSLGAAPSITAAKVVYSTPGVMLIPQEMLPAGFDIHHVALQREGRPLTALAITPEGLLLFGQGYSDDYTDKDAIFLRSTTTPTVAGSATQAHGLFESAQPVNTSSPASVTASYHDVYFDYSLRPYNYPPWFSSKYLTSGSDQSFPIATPSASGGAAALTVNLWSLTQSDHALQVLVNGQPVGQAQWGGGEKMMQLAFQIPSGVLIDGTNQIDFITPTLNGVDSEIAFLHSMSIDYTRTLDGSKPLTITNASAETKLYEVSNLPSASAWVVDARFPDRALLIPYETQAQSSGTCTLHFSAPAGGSGQFLVVPEGLENLPLEVSKRSVKPLKASDYLAVGPSPFSAGVQPLLTRHSKEGLRAAFVDQAQLFDYYNFGRYGPSAIQKAVQATRPQYLLLVGRTTYDYHNYSGANVDPLCPAFLISTTFWAQATSDSMFGDLGRGYPEVAVGRLPVNNASELSGAVSHILAYTGLSSAIRVQATADLADPAAGDFAAESDSIAQANPELAWQRNYFGQTVQTLPEVTNAMTVAANGGADLLLYAGHGNAAHLGQAGETILDSASVQAWTGNVIFLQATCAGNWMANDSAGFKSLAMQALTQPQGGISASIGTSTYMNSQYATEFMSRLLANAGTAQRWGNALLTTQQWTYQRAAQSSFYSDLMRTEQLFGDPAMPVFSKALPNALNTVSPQSAKGTF